MKFLDPKPLEIASLSPPTRPLRVKLAAVKNYQCVVKSFYKVQIIASVMLPLPSCRQKEKEGRTSRSQKVADKLNPKFIVYFS